MNNLNVKYDEVVCDYCNTPYPDKRSLMVHELIHIDKDMDTLSEISDYLPKARQLLPNRMRNNRSFEIYQKKIVSNLPFYGKQYSKVFFVSETIDELLELCKKYPVRESAEPACETVIEGDESPVTEKMSSLYSPPNYSTLASICSPDHDAAPVSSPSSESSSNDSESDQNEAHNKDAVGFEEEQNPPGHISNNESLDDSGYGSSPPEQCLESIGKDSRSPSKSVDSLSVVEIKNLMNNIVTKVVINSDDHLKLRSDPAKFTPNIEKSAPDDDCAMFDFQASDKPSFKASESIEKNVMINSDSAEFKSNVEISAPGECVIQQNKMFDFHGMDKSTFEAFLPVDENEMIDENHQIQNVPEIVFSMPQIIC